MITLAIQLVFQNRAKMSHQEVTNYLIEHLPEGEIVLASGPTKEGEVRLKLDQNALTDQQRDFLHLDEVAMQYIDSYEVKGKSVQEHQHTYSVAAGPVTIRYCTVCGASWVLDGSHGWHWVPVAENKAVDQGRQRDLVHAVENTVQRARDLLAPIYKDNTLNQVDTELGNTMDAMLDLREMLGEETP